MAGQIDLRTYRRLDRQKWINKQTAEHTNGRTCRCLDRQMLGQTDGWTGRWLGGTKAGQTDCRANRRLNRQKVKKQTADHTDIWTDIRGWTDRWLGRQKAGHTYCRDGCASFFYPRFFFFITPLERVCVTTRDGLSLFGLVI
jgi:hypothetical protein